MIALDLASPAGAILCALALVPLAAGVAVLRRNARVASAIGLEPARPRAAWRGAAAAAVACALVGLAAAQPVLRTADIREVRTASEAIFVLDVSRSMAAATSPAAPTRLERARGAALRLRGAVREVPSGLAGLTDRVLPYAFPTADERVFAETLRRAVAIQSPPPQEIAPVATSFAALPALSRDGFFSRGATRRTCILLTDGESTPFTGEVGAALRGRRGCRLLVVHVWGADERVHRPDGTPEANYRPAPDARAGAERLAAAAGGRLFAEQELDAAVAAFRAVAVAGPSGRATEAESSLALAPWLGVAAALLAGFLAAARLAGRSRRPAEWRSEYHPVPEP